MTPPLTISEQERLLKGNELLLKAVDKVIKAQNDLKMFPGSKNYYRALQTEVNNLKAIAKHEKQFINQKQLF